MDQIRAHVRGTGYHYRSGLEAFEIWIPKSKAAALPIILGHRVPISLHVGGTTYEAGLRSTEDNAYIWISPDLRNAKRERVALSEVLSSHGLKKNDVVHLSVDGNLLTIRSPCRPASDRVTQIENTLTRQGVDHQQLMADFGQVEAAARRMAGGRFTLRDHVRGLVLSQLSSNRPWGPIARNRTRIDRIFLDYEPEALKRADPKSLINSITAIGCGNRGIRKQIAALRANIEILESIADLDAYVVSAAPESIATAFASGRYKLGQVGFPLAMEYLRNVGVDTVKPDQHICRIVGPERFGLTDQPPTPEQAHAALMAWASEVGVSALYLDTLLWIFAAKDYGAICSARPRCDICLVQDCRKSMAAQQ